MNPLHMYMIDILVYIVYPHIRAKRAALQKIYGLELGFQNKDGLKNKAH